MHYIWVRHHDRTSSEIVVSFHILYKYHKTENFNRHTRSPLSSPLRKHKHRAVLDRRPDKYLVTRYLRVVFLNGVTKHSATRPAKENASRVVRGTNRSRATYPPHKRYMARKLYDGEKNCFYHRHRVIVPFSRRDAGYSASRGLIYLSSGRIRFSLFLFQTECLLSRPSSRRQDDEI